MKFTYVGVRRLKQAKQAEKLVKIRADDYRITKEQLHKHVLTCQVEWLCFEDHVGMLKRGS